MINITIDGCVNFVVLKILTTQHFKLTHQGLSSAKVSSLVISRPYPRRIVLDLLLQSFWAPYLPYRSLAKGVQL